MASSLDAPKVFISYSWKPITNKQKTISLAERMTSDGVNVILDEWNLSEGQDKNQFMEKMVNDPEIKRVLIICNNDYKEKANQRKGGVGTESLIISDVIYKQADQKKFIPIIFEKNEKGDAYVPTFIHSRIYIDLSTDDIFEDEYEKLLRNIFEKPASKKPPIGTPPAYLFEDNPIFLRTAHKISTIQNALVNERKNCQVFIDDYYATFLLALDDFEISYEDLQTTSNIDDIVVTRIDELKVLRDDLISFFETIFIYSEQFNMDKFLSFLGKLLEFIMKQEANKYPGRVIGHYMSDHYKFFYNEIFLYLTAIMIDKEKFKELGELLYNDFVIFNEKADKTEFYSFILFNQYAESIEKLRNERLQLSRVSIIADLIKQRSDIPKYSFNKLKECDALLYYISIMRNETPNHWPWIKWFPHTTVYDTYTLPILEKLASKRYFEKMKCLFDVNSIEELKIKIKTIIENKTDKLERHDNNIPYINLAFNFDKIGIFK